MICEKCFSFNKAPIRTKIINKDKNQININIIYSEIPPLEYTSTLINVIINHFQVDIYSITLIPLSLCLKTSSISTIKSCIDKNRLWAYYKNSVNLVFGKKAQTIISVFNDIYFNNKIKNYNLFDIIEGFIIEDFDKYSNMLNKKTNKRVKYDENTTNSIFFDSISELNSKNIKKSLLNIVSSFNLNIYKTVFIVLPTIPNLVLDFGKNFLTKELFIEKIKEALDILKNNPVSLDSSFKIYNSKKELNSDFLLVFEDIIKHLDYLCDNPNIPVAIDTETLVNGKLAMQSDDKLTVGFRHPQSAIACISLSYRKEEEIVSFSFPLDVISYTNKWKITEDEKNIIGDKIKEIILKRNKTTSPVIFANAKYDLSWLSYRFNIDPKLYVLNKCDFFDVLLNFKVIDDNRISSGYSLESLAVEILGLSGWKNVIEKWNMIHINKEISNIEKDNITLDLFLYSSKDTKATFLLYEYIQFYINKYEKTLKYVIPYLNVINRVTLLLEMYGIKFDINKLEEISKNIETEIQTIEKDIYNIIEDISSSKYNINNFNIKSNRQIISFINEYFKVNWTSYTKKNNIKFDNNFRKDFLKNTKNKPKKLVSFISLYDKYAELKTVLQSFIKNYTENVYKDGFIYPTINIIGTKTGRTSSNNPNIQQTTDLYNLKTCFIPRNPSNYFLYADYKQAEVRMLAIMSQDKNLMSVFEEKKDPYIVMASKIYNLSIDDVKKNDALRTKMKSVVLGLNYGMSEYGLAKNLDCSVEEAVDLLNDFFKTFPQIKNFHNYLKEFCKNKGYVVGGTFKKRRFPQLLSIKNLEQRESLINEKYYTFIVNAPIQSATSDMCIYNFVKIGEILIRKNIENYFVASIHDGVIYEINIDNLLDTYDIFYKVLPQIHPLIPIYLKSIYGNNFKLIDFEFDMKVGQNWQEYDEKNQKGLISVKTKEELQNYIEKEKLKKNLSN